MDYSKHYDKLIGRAQIRDPVGYFERHHIVPRSEETKKKISDAVRLKIK